MSQKVNGTISIQINKKSTFTCLHLYIEMSQIVRESVSTFTFWQIYDGPDNKQALSLSAISTMSSIVKATNSLSLSCIFRITKKHFQFLLSLK